MKKKLMAIGAAAALLALTACGSGAPTSDAVVFGTLGGDGEKAIDAAWSQPFSEETGIEVMYDSPASMAKALQMVDSNAVTWDVFMQLLLAPADDNPSFEDIDCNIVPCEQFEGGPFEMRKQAVPFFVFSYVTAYNTDKFKDGNAPTGIGDFFNTEDFPGKRLLPANTNGWPGLIEAALIHDGVAREDLYPLDIERALSVFDTIKDSIDVMADDSECITDVSSGEVVMGTCYNGRAAIAKREGLPIDIAWGQQIQTVDYLFIPKGAPHAEDAQKLIAWMVDKENNGKLPEQIAYGPANPLAEVAEDAEWADVVPTAPVNTLEGEQAPILPNEEWWMENRNAVTERISEWLQS
ncbi:MAG: extracellular solute-binding protein [Leucobacter sp.]